MANEPLKRVAEAVRGGATTPAPPTRIPTVAAPPPRPRPVEAPAPDTEHTPDGERTASPPTPAGGHGPNDGSDSGRSRSRREREQNTRSATGERNTGADDTIPGSQKGSMRQVTLYVSASCAEHIANGRKADESLGNVVMDALRSSYATLVERHRDDIGDDIGNVGPFPAPQRHRRRLSVPDARPLSIRVTPAEADAMGKVAKELDTSVSCLVEDAVAATRELVGGAGAGRTEHIPDTAGGENSRR